MSKASRSSLTSESSLRRGDVLVGIAVVSVALGGCMRIYSDPELPDVVTEWSDVDCRPGTGNVVVALIGTTRTEVTVPCTDLGVTFADVAREQYRVEAFLEDSAGEPFSRSDGEVDLRNGFDETVFLYFGGIANYRVSWNFSDGATCESIDADFMNLRFTETDGALTFEDFAPCMRTPHFGRVPDGSYTLVITAIKTSGTVAMSAESEDFSIMDPDLTDLGVITLLP
jgi:hypothetical protein